MDYINKKSVMSWLDTNPNGMNDRKRIFCEALALYGTKDVAVSRLKLLEYDDVNVVVIERTSARSESKRYGVYINADNVYLRVNDLVGALCSIDFNGLVKVNYKTDLTTTLSLIWPDASVTFLD